MNKIYTLLTILTFTGLSSIAQVNLDKSPYTENFDKLGSTGLPNGFSVKHLATASFVGKDTILNSYNPIFWRQITRGFKNFASAISLTDPGTDTTTQKNSSDRALGVRQSTSFGDSGSAFVFQITNTLARKNLKLNFDLQSLDSSSPRTTTWIVDYAIGNAQQFTPVATTPQALTTGNKLFGNTGVSVDFGDALNNSDAPVTIRVVTLKKSIGSGNRASTAIDNWSLSWEEISTSVSNVKKNNQLIRVTGSIASILNLQFTETKLTPITIQLIALNGRTVYQKQLAKVSVGQTEIIDAAHLQSGVYLLNVISKDNNFSTKLVK